MTQISTKKNNSSEIITYILSIQVSLNGLSFCVSNSEVLAKIKHSFDNHAVLKRSFETVEVIYQNNLYTCVPKALFTPDTLKDYLKHTIKVLENDFIAYDELDQHEIVMVYIPYANINNFFFENFGSFTYKHAATILVDRMLSKEKNKETTTVFTHMNATSFDLVVIAKGNLMLSNSYRYETGEDFLYYVMFVAEQLRLNPEEFRLILLGNISKDSPCYTVARTYIRHVDFGSHSNQRQIAEHLPPIGEHEHFVLLSHF